jgi:hypothetical protein
MLLIDPVDMDPCQFWRENQYKYPVLASVARDVLSIPATGAGVERLFNSARDICHYRRGSLNASTIQELMMFMCTSKFEVEEEELALNKEYLSNNELQAAEEETDSQFLEDDLDPISDNEEDDMALVINEPTTAALSENVLGKRRRSIASVPEEESQEPHYSDNDDDSPLPANQQMLRTSKRPRKQQRQDDGFTYY